MLRLWLRGLLIMSAVLAISCQLLPDNNEEDLINPADMINYDASSKTMITKKPRQQQNGHVADARSCNCEGKHCMSKEEYQSLKHQLENCSIEKEMFGKREEAESTCDGYRENTGNEGVFFKQYVKALALNFNTNGGSYRMQVTLSEGDVAALVRFASSKGRLEDAHEVLISMVDHVIALDNPHRLSRIEKIENYLGIDLASLLMIVGLMMMMCVIFSMLVRLRVVPWRQFISRLGLALFVVSVPWNWWHLYKKALAKRHADLLKERPSQCIPSEQSATQSIYQWMASAFTFSSDECARYHEKLLIDPMWEVPPTQALAVTVTKFLLEPLRHIGSAMGDLVRGLLEDMPMYLWPVAIGIFLLLTVFILILVCGYKVRFFWNIFGLEPAYRPLPPQVPYNANQEPQLPPPPPPTAQAIQNVPYPQQQQVPPAILAQPIPARSLQPVLENIPEQHPTDAPDGSWVVVTGPPNNTEQPPVVADHGDGPYHGDSWGEQAAEQQTPPSVGDQEDAIDNQQDVSTTAQPPLTVQVPIHVHQPEVASEESGDRPSHCIHTPPIPETVPHDQEGHPILQQTDSASNPVVANEANTGNGVDVDGQDEGVTHVPSTMFESTDELSIGNQGISEPITPIEEVGVRRG